MSILDSADQTVRKDLGQFVRELNKREWHVRKSGKNISFPSYAIDHYKHVDDFGCGFVVDEKPVPYFHPNRSFHDEVIWLNENLYYNPEADLLDKIVNSAVVKFYGPSKTLEIISSNTPWKYIKVNEALSNSEYLTHIMTNLESAVTRGEKIWGTTELRTSLQTAARDYARVNKSILDPVVDSTRKMRPSDMIHWVLSMVDGGKDVNGAEHLGLYDFYSSKPTMQQSYEYLTNRRGIGAYYGYHLSSNLARLPGIGAESLIVNEFPKQCSFLGIEHGKLDENDDYVVAGPGATMTLSRLWPSIQMNHKTTSLFINAIKADQEKFFGIEAADDLQYLNESSELGRFTTFGIEISCCQYSVFNRLKSNKALALKRAQAPISTSTTGSTGLEAFI